MVEIPEILIERLRGLGPHFIRVSRKGKEPIDKGWVENPMFADNPELQAWLKEGGNYGVACGFGLAVIDADHPEIQEIVRTRFPSSFTVESPGHRSPHYYFIGNLIGKMYLRTRTGEHGGEILWEGFQVVGPNSIHPNGKTYRMINDAPLARISKDQLSDMLGEYLVPEKDMTRDDETARQTKNETGLNLDIMQVASLAGLHRRGNEYYGSHPVHGSENGRNFWVNLVKGVWHCFRCNSGGGSWELLAVETGIIDCSEAHPGALRGEVFKRVLEKAKERGLVKNVEARKQKSSEREEGRKSQADRLVEYCLLKQPTLFHDQHKTPYARVNQNGVNVIMPIRCRLFKAWLAGIMWQAEEKAPGTEALYGAMNVLEAMALFDGYECTLHNRVAPAEDGVWIDMADEKWRAIKVTADGWHIVENPPILFKRYSHQKPLIEPKLGGNPWKFLDFVNIPKEDEDLRLLVLCTVISFLIPTIPHIIIVLYGIQGSGKTIFFMLVRRMIDPSSVELLTLPDDERERVQQLDHHWCAFYDNVTNLPTWMSDTLCRAATGGGFSKRELYTDDDDIIRNFKRCIGLNGINMVAQRGDLLDRSLLVGLQDITREKRKEESEILAGFEQAKGEVLGGFLDTLGKALKEYPSVNPKQLFRMADFTRWGCAIARALGKTDEDFIRAYGNKVRVQTEEAAHSSPIATVLIDFMENRDKWEGTPSEFYRNLNDEAKRLGISTRQKTWPRAPHILVRSLNELVPSLKALGLEVTTGVRTGKARKIIIGKSVTSVTRDTSEKPKNDDDDDASDGSGISSSRQISFEKFHLEEVVYCKRMDLAQIGECTLCGKKPQTLTHTVKTFLDHRQVCHDCADIVLDYLKKHMEES